DEAQVLRAIDEHVKGRSSHFSIEHRLRAANGSWKWILTSGKAFGHDSEGKPLRAAGTHLDVTARKEAEAAAHEFDRRLARILESMVEACSSVDADWRYTFVNPQWEAFFGLRKEGVIGRVMWEISPEINGTQLEEIYRKAMETRESIRREIFSPTIHRWLEI